MSPDNDTLEYAAPEPMGRKRFTALVGTAAVSGLVIGGVVYVLGSATTATMVTAGRPVAPRPVLATQPSPPPLPRVSAPTSAQWQEASSPEKKPAGQD